MIDDGVDAAPPGRPRRRRLLVAAALAAAAMALASLLRRSSGGPRLGWRALGPVPSADGWHPHPEGVWVIREQGRVAVLERRCPHQGCLLQRREDDLWCPCHGSTFEPDGRRLVGPATRGLVWFDVRIDGQLWWHPGRSGSRARWVTA